MSHLLFVTSSMFGPNSKSRQIGSEFIESWRAAHPDLRVVERDLAAAPPPHVNGEQFAAFLTGADERSPVQRDLARAADGLIEELEAADTVVIAAPMYNFAIPSTLKSWLDHVTRAGRTFRYTPQGPEGLLKNKKVFVIASRGGVYTGESPMREYDFQEPYLRKMLGFLGMADVTFIHVEGLQISPDMAAAGLARARSRIREIVPAANAA